jgi:hypothetical protein
MDDVFLTARIDNRRSICISPLPAKTYKQADAKGLGGDFGYFIYETDAACPGAGIEIIGKAASLDAALRLFEVICRSLNQTSPIGLPETVADAAKVLTSS